MPVSVSKVCGPGISRPPTTFSKYTMEYIYIQ